MTGLISHWTTDMTHPQPPGSGLKRDTACSRFLPYLECVLSPCSAHGSGAWPPISGRAPAARATSFVGALSGDIAESTATTVKAQRREDP